jgi:hypothetical protein
VTAQDAVELVGLVRLEMEQAAEVMLGAAEKGLRHVGEAEAGDTRALDRLRQIFCAIMEACSFQDICGQRLSRLASLVSEVPGGAAAAAADPLLNGPAPPGSGLGQAAADDLFASSPASRVT